MVRKKNILVCPLDWGLGHATRMVPIIKAIDNHGANAILAADNQPLEFLQQYFPKNKTIKLQGYSPKYPVNGSMTWAMIKSIPEMVKYSRLANNDLQIIIEDYNIDAVISDNRYELSTSKVPTIFITHQLNIQTSGLQSLGKPLINYILKYYIKKYDEIWIPDIDGVNNLSGVLSKSNKFNDKKYHIGLLSRFSKISEVNISDDIDVLIILSGPEPQRSILEKLLLQQSLQTDLKTIILQGKPKEYKVQKIDNVKLISHLNDHDFSSLLRSAKCIISRPGYSTLMDMAVIGCKAVFIPTPGQTEQEYLAKKLRNEGKAYSESQNNFKLIDAIQNQDDYLGLSVNESSNLLNQRIQNLLNIC